MATDGSHEPLRLFRTAPTAFEATALQRLGESMVYPTEARGIGPVPVGYTYLGQFIDHDITTPSPEARQPLHHGDPLEVGTLPGNSPALDLDSVYGTGKDDPRVEYTPCLRFAVGRVYEDRLDLDGRATSRCADALPRDRQDLPRAVVDGRLVSVIADCRNDENLIVGQVHLLFLRAHNVLIDHFCAQGLDRESAFLRARQELVSIYQRIVRDDFLPTICNEAVYRAVFHDRKPVGHHLGHLDPVRLNRLQVPVEFSAAAFRFGHCIVRQRYALNDCHERSMTTGQIPSVVELTDLIRYTSRGGLGGLQALPRTFKLDWARFFEFQGAGRRPFRAHAFAPRVIGTFGRLPLRRFNLAARNLARQNTFALPSGQAVVRSMDAGLRETLGIAELSPEELEQVLRGPDAHAGALSAQDIAAFKHSTPLWYYLMAEADVREGGNRLGPLGSYIVAETLRALMVTSRTSIYGPEGELVYRLNGSVLNDFLAPSRGDGAGGTPRAGQAGGRPGPGGDEGQPGPGGDEGQPGPGHTGGAEDEPPLLMQHLLAFVEHEEHRRS